MKRFFIFLLSIGICAGIVSCNGGDEFVDWEVPEIMSDWDSILIYSLGPELVALEQAYTDSLGLRYWSDPDGDWETISAAAFENPNVTYLHNHVFKTYGYLCKASHSFYTDSNEDSTAVNHCFMTYYYTIFYEDYSYAMGWAASGIKAYASHPEYEYSYTTIYGAL